MIKKVLVAILGLAFIVIMLLPGGHDPKSIFEYFDDDSYERNLDAEMQKLISHLSLGLPKMVDPDTRLESIERIDKELRYNYTLVNHTESDLAQMGFNEGIREIIKPEACILLKTEFFSYYDMSVSFFFKDKNKSHVNTFSFKQADCTGS